MTGGREGVGRPERPTGPSAGPRAASDPCYFAATVKRMLFSTLSFRGL
jgi:hypothetical protein